MSLLDVVDLRTQFLTEDGVVRAVDGLSFSVAPAEIVAIVGESGCGKSVTSMSILRLQEGTHCRVAGQIRFAGIDLLALAPEAMRRVRGNEISMIFQEPMSSLNPVLTIGTQITETLRQHQDISARAATERAVHLLRMVGIPEPERRLGQHPHLLSGGMRQRVMVAMALACNPKLLIADEPTTALDVTVQAQILDLMRDLRDRTGAAVILITHDIGVVAEIADRVIVMYAGRKVEEAPVTMLFHNPQHPYTRGLMNAVPRLEAGPDGMPGRLAEIPGSVPSLKQHIPGCAFALRCPHALDECSANVPEFRHLAPGHGVACINPVGERTGVA